MSDISHEFLMKFGINYINDFVLYFIFQFRTRKLKKSERTKKQKKMEPRVMRTEGFLFLSVCATRF